MGVSAPPTSRGRYFLFIYLLLLFETDYNTSLSRVESLSEAIKKKESTNF